MYRGINDSKKGYQPRTNVVKDEKSELVADPHSILAMWRNYFSQLLNVHGVNDVRQTEIHITEPQVPKQSAFEVELVTEKLKVTNHRVLIKSQQNLLKQGMEQLVMRSINLLFVFGIRRNCLRSRSLYLSIIIRAIKQTVVIIWAYHFCQLHTKFYPTSCCQG